MACFKAEYPTINSLKSMRRHGLSPAPKRKQGHLLERFYPFTYGSSGGDGFFHCGSPYPESPSGRTPLLGPSPLRTVRKAFAVYGSSPSSCRLVPIPSRHQRTTRSLRLRLGKRKRSSCWAFRVTLQREIRTALSLFSFKTDYLFLEEAKLSPRLSLAAATT